MIIKGTSRAGPGALAAHLSNAEKNERVQLLETRGTLATDLRGALIEMDAYAAGTRCQKSLYHAALSPEPPHRLSPEQRAEALDALEDRLGLTGHARVAVMHKKEGREHLHVVWSRIDLATMKAVHDGHNYRKHEEVARDLERRFGHDRVQGAHHEREAVARPDRTPSRSELRQEERTGITGKQVKAEVTAAFRSSDNAEAFKSALEDAGYQLARGDRRDFVIVDRAGGIHSLARRTDGMKAAELREFMAPIDREGLPTLEEAREIAAERERQRRAGHEEALIEKAYSKGADYVSQTRAALKEHEWRQAAIDNDAPRPQRPETLDVGSDRDRRDRDSGHTRSQAQQNARRAEEDHAIEKSGRRPGPAVEMSDAQRARMERLLGSERGERERSDGHDDDDPDRQREAPGGGRTRSR